MSEVWLSLPCCVGLSDLCPSQSFYFLNCRNSLAGLSLSQRWLPTGRSLWCSEHMLPFIIDRVTVNAPVLGGETLQFHKAGPCQLPNWSHGVRYPLALSDV